MSLRRRLKKILKYTLEGQTLTITPHSSESQLTIKIPRVFMFLILLVLIVYLLFATFMFRNYIQKYVASVEVIDYLESVKIENELLRTELVSLYRETEELRDDIIVLQRQGQRIQSIISEELLEDEEQFAHISTLEKLLSYKPYDINPGGLGGSTDFGLKHDAFGLIQGMHQDLKRLREAIPAQQQDMEHLEENVREYNAIMAATPSIWPLLDKGTGYISSSFGFRRDPFSGQQAFHEGIDIGVWYGTPVVATAEGTISFAGWRTGYGYTVMIDHGYGFETLYAHNSEIVVREGDRVKRGDVVAYSGNTGRSTAPHLHYEVRVNGIPHNPLKYIND